MAVEMCAGVWRTRSGDLVNVQWRTPGGFWVCADGFLRRDNGTYRRGEQNDQDLVAFVSLPGRPRSQRDAVAELAAEQLQQLGKTELNCWIDDACRAVIPYGPEAVIAAIRELVEITVEQWPEQRARLLQELQTQQQRLSE